MPRKKGESKNARKKSSRETDTRKARKKDKHEEVPAKNDAEKSCREADFDEMEAITAERDELLDRLKRSAADFSNYQKRMQRDSEEIRKYAASPLMKELLAVIDNLHRAIDAAAAGKLEEGFLKGFKMIEDQLSGVLGKHGVSPIEAVNKPFDPNFHDALLEVEDPSLPDKTVVEELEKGYIIHDRLLRPTKARVSRLPHPQESEEKIDDLENSIDDNNQENVRASNTGLDNNNRET